MNGSSYNITQQYSEEGRFVCIREASEQIDSWYQRNTVDQKKVLSRFSPKVIKIVVILLFLFSLYLPQHMFAGSDARQQVSQFVSPIPKTQIIFRK